MKSEAIFIICVLAFAASPLQAQLVKSYGLKAGAVSAKQMWDYSRNIDFPAERRWGFDAGVFVEGLNIPYFSLLAEAHYVQKGFRITLPITTPAYPEGTGEEATFEPRVDYLSIPVLVKIRFETGTLTPYVIGGPRIDFLIGKNVDAAGTVYDDLKKTDIGGSLGAGVEIPFVAGTGLITEFRYSPSFTTIFADRFLTIKNESFELLLGVRL